MQAHHADRTRNDRHGKLSAGLLLWRLNDAGEPEVFLVHPGGPFWARRDAGAWSIPKGELEPGEDPQAAAAREFAEETGLPVPGGDWQPLPPVRLKSGKEVVAWAVQVSPEQAPDPQEVRANTFTMEWPPRSGRMAEFPEIDRAAWLSLNDARRKANAAYAPWFDIIERLAEEGAA